MASSKILNEYVPHISKASFDEEASAFLSSYYPEALEAPMAVPIEEIAKNKLGLLVVEKRLTEDFSVLGQMCFTGVLPVTLIWTENLVAVKLNWTEKIKPCWS